MTWFEIDCDFFVIFINFGGSYSYQLFTNKYIVIKAGAMCKYGSKHQNNWDEIIEIIPELCFCGWNVINSG